MPAVQVMVAESGEMEALELGAEHTVTFRHGRGKDGVWGQEHLWGTCERDKREGWSL